jgi:hypothetical protein
MSLLGFDIAMSFRGETVSSFAFSLPVPMVLPIQAFKVGLDVKGSAFIVRASVNGFAKVPEKVVKVNNQFHSGVIFNPLNNVLDLRVEVDPNSPSDKGKNIQWTNVAPIEHFRSYCI